MINIVSIYYFTLLQRLSPKYKESLNSVIRKISRYIEEEGIEYTIKKKVIGEYEVISYRFDDVGEMHLFHRSKRGKDFFYYPSFFCDVYINKELLRNTQTTKKVIFLLSNIFECFDEFDEKNMMIEFHKDIEETLHNKKEYSLRHDFLNINSLTKVYSDKRISRDIKKFIEKNPYIANMSSIKHNHPDIYRTLLFFLYNIFALQKNFDSTNKKLLEIKNFQQQSGENTHISLSEERLKMNKQSIEKVLDIYKQNFESFMNILTRKS